MSLINQSLAFDDVLLLPNYSEVLSRKEVDLTMNVAGASLTLPIYGAPMNTVCGHEMAKSLHMAGGFGILHRYNTIDEQVKMYKKLRSMEAAGFCAIGTKQEGLDRAYRLFTEAGCSDFCIDVAHGHHILVKELLYAIRNHIDLSFRRVCIMAGNVATWQGSMALAEWGADIVRGSVGGGSACTTRRVTGFGESTLQWVLDTKAMFMGKNLKTAIVADGGIRNSGDAMKCYVAGADAVMCGSLLSGTFESPGEIFIDKLDGKQYKLYQGMASFNAMTDWNPERTNTTPEGVATSVRYKGHVKGILQEFKGGLQSGCSYAGIDALSKAHTNVKMVRVSESGLRESHPHILEK